MSPYSGPQSEQSRPLVLVVDDSPLDRRLAGACLKDEDLDATYASNGREALDVLEKEDQRRPDLVLTDLQMPEMDGLELVQEVRNSYPTIPVILMTAHGSEEIAVTALKTGASSYVPKKNLARDLAQTIRVVMSVASVKREQQRVLASLMETQSTFLVANDVSTVRPLIHHIQDLLREMSICEEAELVRVGAALQESLTNAIEHGNLELSSELRESQDGSYVKLAEERTNRSPYKDRRVHVTTRLTKDQAVCVIRDEGPGFDPSTLPDPTDPTNLERVSGRGLLLIRTFMDDVTFNNEGNEITLVKRTKKN